jgi:hypothetical protein
MSKIENELEAYRYEKLLPFEFQDKTQFSFNAKTDILFKDVFTGEVWIGETKMDRLNSKTTIAASRTALLNQVKFRGLAASEYASHNELSGILWPCYHFDCLKFGWNHSKYKHAIISKRLQELGLNYMVIFSKHDPYIGKAQQPFKLHYQKLGISHCLLLSEFRDREKQGRYRLLSSEEVVEFELELIRLSSKMD